MEGGVVTGACKDGVAGGGGGFAVNFRGTLTVLAFDPRGGVFHAKFTGGSTCRYANGEIMLTGF